MKKREADFGLTLRHWLRANPRFSAAFELKQTRSNALSFDALEDHQADYLLALQGDKGVLMRVQGVNGEPDYVYMRNFPAYVVVRFPKKFHIISIDTFLAEKKRSLRKSLTSARAEEISVISVKLSPGRN